MTEANVDSIASYYIKGNPFGKIVDLKYIENADIPHILLKYTDILDTSGLGDEPITLKIYALDTFFKFISPDHKERIENQMSPYLFGNYKRLEIDNEYFIEEMTGKK